MKIEFLTRQLIKIMIFLLEHPAGKLKSEAEREIPVDPHGNQDAFDYLSEERYIEQVDPFNARRNKKWILTKKGEYFALLLKGVIEEKKFSNDEIAKIILYF